MRGPMAGLLNLVLDKVLQGSEFHLAAATSVHIILICNKPDVKELGAIRASSTSFPSRLRQEISKDGPKPELVCLLTQDMEGNILEYIQGWGSLGSNPILYRSTEARPPRETSILHRVTLTTHLSCKGTMKLSYLKCPRNLQPREGEAVGHRNSPKQAWRQQRTQI